MEAPTRPSRELVWPPPQEELDALEVVLLRSPAPTSTPSGTDASSDSSSGAPLVDPTQASPRRRFLRIAAVAGLMLLAMMVGVWLGARHARQSIAVASDSPAPAPESASAAPARVEAPTSPSPSPALPTAAASPSPLSPRASAASAVPASVAASAPLATSSPAAGAPLVPSSPPPQPALASMAAAPSVAPAPSLSPSISPSTDASATASASGAPPPDTALPDAKPLSDIPGTIGARQPPAPPAARRAETASIQVTGPDEAGVRRALDDYQRAYDTLDANAAAARWPSVDAAALARAFSGLKSQAVVFDRCQLLVGTSTARASCIGSSTVVRQVGSARPVTEPRQWTFTLRRASSDDWMIDHVQTDALTPALSAR